MRNENFERLREEKRLGYIYRIINHNLTRQNDSTRRVR
jgi:hypothetical protein